MALAGAGALAKKQGTEAAEYPRACRGQRLAVGSASLHARNLGVVQQVHPYACPHPLFAVPHHAIRWHAGCDAAHPHGRASAMSEVQVTLGTGPSSGPFGQPGVLPSPATHAIWTVLKAGETVYLLYRMQRETHLGALSGAEDTSRHCTSRISHFCLDLPAFNASGLRVLNHRRVFGAITGSLCPFRLKSAIRK